MVRVMFVASNKYKNRDAYTPSTSQLKSISKEPREPKSAYKYWYEETYAENLHEAQMARRTKDTKAKWDTYLHDRCRHVWEKLTPEEKVQYKKLAEKDLFRFLKEYVIFQNEKEDENQEDAEDEKKKNKELKKTFRYNGKICRFSDFEKELEMIKREVLKTNKKSLVQKKNQKSKKREEEDVDEVVELSSDMEE